MQPEKVSDSRAVAILVVNATLLPDVLTVVQKKKKRQDGRMLEFVGVIKFVKDNCVSGISFYCVITLV